MNVTMCGARGTCTLSRADSMKFGGDTTCVAVRGGGGESVIIDAGTGIRELGRRMDAARASEPALLLVTHYHLDHVIGLPSFSPLYRGEFSCQVASPVRNGLVAETVLSQLMKQPYWPVQMEELRADIRFLSWERSEADEPYRFGRLEIRWCPVHHPGGCTAYRIDDPGTGRSFVFATDVEWSISTPAERTAFQRLCRDPGPPSLLVFDGQFSRENYVRAVGWGHSAWEDAVDVARDVGAKLLLVTHHAPESNDARLDAVERDLGAVMPEARLARDGMEVQL